MSFIVAARQRLGRSRPGGPHVARL